TQTIPADAAERSRFAARLGTTSLENDLLRHTSAVSRLFKTLGDEPDDRPDIDAILRGELSEDNEAAALARLGFADVTAARAELARARRRPGSPLSPAAIDRSARIGALLFSEIAASADP